MLSRRRYASFELTVRCIQRNNRASTKNFACTKTCIITPTFEFLRSSWVAVKLLGKKTLRLLVFHFNFFYPLLKKYRSPLHRFLKRKVVRVIPFLFFDLMAKSISFAREKFALRTFFPGLRVHHANFKMSTNGKNNLIELFPFLFIQLCCTLMKLLVFRPEYFLCMLLKLFK